MGNGLQVIPILSSPRLFVTGSGREAVDRAKNAFIGCDFRAPGKAAAFFRSADLSGNIQIASQPQALYRISLLPAIPRYPRTRFPDPIPFSSSTFFLLSIDGLAARGSFSRAPSWFQRRRWLALASQKSLRTVGDSCGFKLRTGVGSIGHSVCGRALCRVGARKFARIIDIKRF